MNEFGAANFYAISTFFESVSQIVEHDEREVPEEGRKRLQYTIGTIAESCEAISLVQSALATRRLQREMNERMGSETLRANLRSVTQLIYSEINAHLFLWVPTHRSEWYSADAHSILGEQCCKRFASIQREIEEAAKCYALGRYTACAFHLMRSTEAGVSALAKAIKFAPTHRGWGLVFKELERQSKAQPSPSHWKTHRKFLNQLSGDLVALTKAWRNDVAHLVDTYTEENAKELLTVIPMFLRDMAAHLDENGKLY